MEENVDKIKQTVLDFYNADASVFKTKSRKKEIINVKHISLYMCYKHLSMTLELIGTMFDVNHATVLHAVNKITDWAQTDKKLDDDINKLHDMIRSKLNEDSEREFKFHDNNGRSITFKGYSLTESEKIIKQVTESIN
jgi:hypothetical protein